VMTPIVFLFIPHPSKLSRFSPPPSPPCPTTNTRTRTKLDKAALLFCIRSGFTRRNTNQEESELQYVQGVQWEVTANGDHGGSLSVRGVVVGSIPKVIIPQVNFLVLNERVGAVKALVTQAAHVDLTLDVALEVAPEVLVSGVGLLAAGKGAHKSPA